MLPYVLQVGVLLVFPLAFIVSLWRSREPDLLRWLLKAAYTGIFLLYLFLLARWDLSSTYLKYVFAFLYTAALAQSLRAAKELPFIAAGEASRWKSYAVPGALLVFFSGLLWLGSRGYFYSEESASMEFPLRDGWFYVGQGGNSAGVNYHNPNEAQRYALDIVSLNEWGSRATGLYPQDLSRYVIFGKPVFSPCNGWVTAVVDRFPDQVPPETDRENVAGNHVVLSCSGVLVLLAHLQSGSIQVREGQSVNRDTRIGAVGNSGNTSEPHLHVHAVRAGSGGILTGEGVPLLFGGRFLVRNATF